MNFPTPVAGTAWNPNGRIFDDPLYPNKEIVLVTNYAEEPGLIYYYSRNKKSPENAPVPSHAYEPEPSPVNIISPSPVNKHEPSPAPSPIPSSQYGNDQCWDTEMSNAGKAAGAAGAIYTILRLISQYAPLLLL
jgi:hypothetical protein